jgi:hypothetical protein
MKTKTFLLLCLFIGMAMSQISAQTKSYVAKDIPYPFGYWAADVWCDGVLVDQIVGSGTAHLVYHEVNGQWAWGILMLKGQGISWWTGEKFTFSEQDKWDTPFVEMWTCHTNLKGSKGTMYNISLDLSNGGYEVKNATCTGNSPY